ncbi:MAG: hypothetical protein GYA22_14880 [Bacteroidales bacterium]|nr:hypothetical protein [Bacteroidales bacterium]
MSSEPLFERLIREWDETTSLLKEAKEKGKLSALDADLLRTRFVRMYDLLLELKTGVRPPEYFTVGKGETPSDQDAGTLPIREKSRVQEPEKITVREEPAPASEEKKLIEEPVNQSVVKSQKTKPKAEILADKFVGSRKFMHDRLAENISEKKDLSSVMKSRPISNIESAIGLNEKFLFIKELFGGNAHHYKETIDVLNNAAGYDEAINYIRRNFAWNEDDPVVMQLLELVQRRHSRQV